MCFRLARLRAGNDAPLPLPLAGFLGQQRCDLKQPNFASLAAG